MAIWSFSVKHGSGWADKWRSEANAEPPHPHTQGEGRGGAPAHARWGGGGRGAPAHARESVLPAPIRSLTSAEHGLPHTADPRHLHALQALLS